MALSLTTAFHSTAVKLPNLDIVQLPEQSLYSHLVHKEPLMTQQGETLPRFIALSNKTKGMPMGVDNGNYALKLVMMHAKRNELVSHRVLTAVGPVSTKATKSSATRYRVRDLDVQPSAFSEPFHIGKDAMNYSSASHLSLAVGSTAERLYNTRLLHFFLAGHIDLMVQAEYAPETTYHILPTYGFPNDEFVDGELRQDSFDALGQIEGHTFEIERQTGNAHPIKYILHLVEGYVSESPQTSGTFTATNFSLRGELLPTAIREQQWMDFGGGHTQDYLVKFIPNDTGELEVVGSGGKLGVGRGMVEIARELATPLRERYPNMALSEIHLQNALATGRILINGQEHPLDQVISADWMNQIMEAYLSETLPILQRQTAAIGLTGGGLSQELLWTHLQKQMTQRSGGIFDIDRVLAATLNSYGLYLQSVIQALALAEA